MSEAREAILAAVCAARGPAFERKRFDYSIPAGNLISLFTANAKKSDADVASVASREEVPAAIAAFLAAVGAPPVLYVPKNSLLRSLSWQRAPKLSLSAEPPGSEDTALSEAGCAIAETGTLLFASGAQQPASWHFLPGREIALLPRARIVARLEDAVVLLGPGFDASTINLVTGPSRTGDIEQIIERGAHGPRALHVLIYG
ncbi:MAG: LutC/YkgG family protein [Alphaproteobacteria bacterium]